MSKISRKNTELICEDGTATIQLTRGYTAVIDAADVEKVNHLNWHAITDHRKDGSVRQTYAVARVQRDGKTVRVYMHRMLLDAPKNRCVDHKDDDGLNNRRSNLRLATRAQNKQYCRLFVVGTSLFRGVFFNKRTSKWAAQIQVNGKQHRLGNFNTAEAAAHAYDDAARRLHGEFACVNFPRVGEKSAIVRAA